MTCSHGTHISCDWHECGQCVQEEWEMKEQQEQTDLLRQIANNSGRNSSLEDENRRLREELDRLKGSR